jgi:hypothetical protein
MTQPTKQLYTVKITTVCGTVYPFYNQTKEDLERCKANTFKCGLWVKVDENTRELISPFLIKQVLAIRQQGEVSGTMDNITGYQKPPM